MSSDCKICSNRSWVVALSLPCLSAFRRVHSSHHWDSKICPIWRTHLSACNFCSRLAVPWLERHVRHSLDHRHRNSCVHPISFCVSIRGRYSSEKHAGLIGLAVAWNVEVMPCLSISRIGLGVFGCWPADCIFLSVAWRQCSLLSDGHFIIWSLVSWGCSHVGHPVEWYILFNNPAGCCFQNVTITVFCFFFWCGLQILIHLPFICSALCLKGFYILIIFLVGSCMCPQR